MRRQRTYLRDNITSRLPGCLFLGLVPLIAILACGLLFQTMDLLASEPVPPAPRVVPASFGETAAGVELDPALAQRRVRPSPTPGTVGRLIETVTGFFGDPSPTPTQARSRTVVAAATPMPPTPTPPPVDTPTPTFTPNPPPAATPPAPSPTVPPTATPPPVKPQVSAASEVNVRSGPDTSYPVVGSLAPNSSLPVTGRTQDSSWWQVQLADGQSGWVAGWVVEASDTGNVPVAAAPPPPAPALVQPQPAQAPAVVAEPVSPLPTPAAQYDFLLNEFFNSPTTNSFLVMYVAIVDANEIPIGDLKIVGTRLDHNLTYESPLSTWYYEGYNAPGQVQKSGNLKFEPPGGIEATSWLLHLEDAQGNRLSDDVPFDTDPADKQWYFVKFRRSY